MANLVLVGAVQISINNVFSATATKFSISGDKPVTVKFGAQGSIGSAQGQEKPSGSITLAVPTTGLEFDITTLQAKAGFSFTFSVGSERHAVFGCQITKRNFTNTPESGDTEFAFDFVGTEWIRTA